MRTVSMIILSCVFLSACSSEVLPAILDGEQTVVGVLEPAELSAVRRGSHIITQDGISVYYAESSLVNLRKYQDKRVTLRGNFEHNTDVHDLPVLVVDSIVDVEETLQEHTLSALSMRITVPVHWGLTQSEGTASFAIEGEEGPELLVISQMEGDTLPDGGVPIVVDATRATRFIDELSSSQIVHVKRENTILTLQFTPGTRLSAQRLQEDFIQALTSVELLSGNTTSTPTFGTGTLSTPCGGTAGILCPENYFCDIQDFEQNIGRCRKL